MLFLKCLLLLLGMVGQMYVLKFQSNLEGKDERGVVIQYQTTRFLFHLFYLGVVILLILNLIGYITPEQLVDILLYFFVSLGIFGAVYSYLKRRI